MSDFTITPTKRSLDLPSIRGNAIVMGLYLLFLLLPIYWLVMMSLKTNSEILNSFTLWPRDLTFDNYLTILTDASWYTGYLNSMAYVVMNMVISLLVALPAAYAFSRYTFMGDKHLFFWLLTNRMAPPAVFALPFFQLYSSVGLFDTHIAVALAHCLFNVPLAVWILEGFMRGVPKEIDETAYIDGYSFPRFFIRIFTPLVALWHRCYRVLSVSCFQLGRTAAQPHAHIGKRKTNRRHNDPYGGCCWHRLGCVGCGWGSHDPAGCFGYLLCPQLHRQGLCPGPRLSEEK